MLIPIINGADALPGTSRQPEIAACTCRRDFQTDGRARAARRSSAHLHGRIPIVRRPPAGTLAIQCPLQPGRLSRL